MMTYDDNKKLEVLIKHKSISVDSKTAFCDMRLLFTNRTDTAFLLYGFSNYESWYGTDSSYKQDDITVGLVFLTTGLNGKREIHLNSPEWKTNSSKVIYTYDRFLKDIKGDYLVVPKNSTIQKTIRLEFIKERIQKGSYRITLIYYCGKNVTSVIPEIDIKNDEAINKALIYQGYAKSNTVNLIVN